MDSLISNTDDIAGNTGHLVEVEDENRANNEEYELSEDGKTLKKKGGTQEEDIELPDISEGANSVAGTSPDTGSSGPAYKAKKDKDGNVHFYNQDDQEVVQGPDGTPIVIEEGEAAGGYNNHLRSFASGKQNGFIAVTGELGPELRVKSNGSIDLLGQ